MSSEKMNRGTWSTRIGFIFASVGSAVGLGNIWRFPFQAGQEGGSAFLFIYLLFVVLVGLPALLVELIIGRGTHLNAVGALRETGGAAWKYLGGLFIVIGFIVLSYYSVVAGWTLRYLFGSVTGGYMEAPEGYFLDIATGIDAVIFHALFMALVIAIVAVGVKRGIEKGVKLMVPAIVGLLAVLAIYGFTLESALDAYIYYLSPDIDVIKNNWRSIVPSAAGQAFFTLSLGMGVMITYSSYITEDRNLAEDAGIIIAIDSAIAFGAGLVVFPILLTAGIDPASQGPAAVFVALASAFGDISLGILLGTVFFALLSLAALSSGISILEVVVSYAIDEHGVDRKKASIGIGALTFIIGLPATVDTVLIDLYDILVSEILLVIGGLLLMILVGWFVPQKALDELSRGTNGLGNWGTTWIWLVRVPVIVALVVALVLAIDSYIEFLTGDFADFLTE